MNAPAATPAMTAPAEPVAARGAKKARHGKKALKAVERHAEVDHMILAKKGGKKRRKHA